MVERGGIRPVALRAEDDQPLLAPVAEDDVVVDILTLKDRPICPADGTPVRWQRRRREATVRREGVVLVAVSECGLDVVTGEMPAVSRASTRQLAHDRIAELDAVLVSDALVVEVIRQRPSPGISRRARVIALSR
jgi:hypothetical protein